MAVDVTRRAAAFWRTAGTARVRPANVEDAVCWALPVGVIHVPGLTAGMLDRWPSQASPRRTRRGVDRELHGALLARGGLGLIIVDGRDPENERRFTIAHETAHFMLDYLEPRERALAKFGPHIAAVMDGERAPSVTERLDAILREVPLGVHAHLAERGADNMMTCDAERAELAADRLAFELLAPRQVVRTRCPRSVSSIVRFVQILVEDFGFPPQPARCYAQLLAAERETSFREWLTRDHVSHSSFSPGTRDRS